MKLLFQVGTSGQAVQIPLQDVPAHLVVEGEAELGMNLSMCSRQSGFCFKTDYYYCYYNYCYCLCLFDFDFC